MDHWNAKTCCGHETCEGAVAEMECRLHAAEVERDAALVQLREQNAKLDRAESTVTDLIGMD